MAPWSLWGPGFFILSPHPWSSYGGTPAPAVASLLEVKDVTVQEQCLEEEQGKAALVDTSCFPLVRPAAVPPLEERLGNGVFQLIGTNSAKKRNERLCLDS